MTSITSKDLAARKCAACEGLVKAYSRQQAEAQLEMLNGWTMSEDGPRIRKQWTAKNFLAAITFFNRVAELAENEGHHPDLHLQDYRNVTIEIYTHAVGGLTENDFILAAKIDLLPVATK